MNAAALKDELKETAEGIDAARGLVNDGQVVDLAGLEARVEDLCARIKTVDAQDRDRLKPTLVAIIDGLDSLAEALTKQRDGIGGAIREITTHHRAASAYTGARNPGQKNPKK
jgi:hypothetical protein